MKEKRAGKGCCFGGCAPMLKLCLFSGEDLFFYVFSSPFKNSRVKRFSLFVLTVIMRNFQVIFSLWERRTAINAETTTLFVRNFSARFSDFFSGVLSFPPSCLFVFRLEISCDCNFFCFGKVSVFITRSE